MKIVVYFALLFSVANTICMENVGAQAAHPLIDAVKSALQNPKTVLPQELLDQNKNEQDEHGRTALWWAAHAHNASLVDQLIKAGVDVNLSDNDEVNPLLTALIPAENPTQTLSHIVLSLINAGADVSMLGFCTLHKSCIDIVSLLKKYENNSRWFNFEGTRIIKTLVRAYMLQNGTTGDVWPREFSSIFFDNALMRIIDSPTAFGELHDYLKAHKTHINDQDELGATLLIYAAALGDKNIVELLLNLGADSSLKTKTGKDVFAIVNHLNTNSLGTERKVRYEEVIRSLLSPSKLGAGVGFAEREAMRQPVVVPLQTTSGDIFVAPTSPPVVSVPDIGQPFGEQPQAKPAQPAKPEWKKPFAWTAGTAFGALLARLGYNTMYLQAPSDLDKKALHVQLITALANKKYDYALQLALHNPESMRQLAADGRAQQNLKALIDQAESAIINEIVQDATLNPFQRILQPSSSVQLQQLASLLRLLEQK